MALSDKEELLNNACDEALSKIYDYFQFAGVSKSDEYTTDLMNKMTDAIKATIRFNNSLTKALKDRVIELTPQALSILNTYYAYYDQMPKREEEVSEVGGSALMEVYTGMLKNMTPIALMISTQLSAKMES